MRRERLQSRTVRTFCAPYTPYTSKRKLCSFVAVQASSPEPGHPEPSNTAIHRVNLKLEQVRGNVSCKPAQSMHDRCKGIQDHRYRLKARCMVESRPSSSSYLVVEDDPTSSHDYRTYISDRAMFNLSLDQVHKIPIPTSAIATLNCLEPPLRCRLYVLR